MRKDGYQILASFISCFSSINIIIMYINKQKTDIKCKKYTEFLLQT